MNDASLQESFKASAANLEKPCFTKINDVCLMYRAGHGGGYSGVYMWIDFLARKTIIGDHQRVVKFCDDDRDTLEFMRDKLIELKGNPPPLPAVKEQTPQPKFRVEAP